jgi:ankyrin repeat protein
MRRMKGERMSDSSNTNQDHTFGTTKESELHAAIREGNPGKICCLIEAGADLHYKCQHGYDALIDAVHSNVVDDDPGLLELLALLIAKGVDLSGVSEYGESGLRVLSRLGRFDAVRMLLKAGADKNQLEWTPLIAAVALGSLADVRSVLERGAMLEVKDWWERTAWLIALLIGDVDKAKLLQEYGADPNVRGRCGRPPLFYVIQGHHPDVLRWLLREGQDVHQTDEFGTTALIEAVDNDDLECVRILLDAGANVAVNANGTALGRARSREIINCLLDEGADPADADQRVILGLRDLADDALAAVSPDDFQRAFTRYFGKRSPERMREPFWEAMIRCGSSAYHACQQFQETCGAVARPVWCAQRFGQSLTLLPDGRAVQVGGEHEDFYDPDFCIYNDVFVHEKDGTVAIYGYPEAVFPPTDFHTATLVGDFVYLIGALGYQGSRRFGETPVYRLDIRTLRINRLDTGGEAPGWIYQHRAVAVPPHGIRVWGGIVVNSSDSGESHEENLDAFVLDLDRLSWYRES